MTPDDLYMNRHFPQVVGESDTAPKLLKSLRFKGLNVSHIGAIKSCLEYFQIPCSDGWLFGVTGQAFLLGVDEHVLNRTPNFCPSLEQVRRLAHNAGLQIEGISRHAEGEEYQRLQRLGADQIRSAIDSELPCFGRGLDEPSETTVIIGYADEGFYTHGWHQRGAEPIPWERLGQAYCPCDECTARHRATGDSAATQGYVDIHWARPTSPADDREAVREALRFVLAYAGDSSPWQRPAVETGLAAYDTWIRALTLGSAEGFHVGYTCDQFKESRCHAVEFLKEAETRLGERYRSLFQPAIAAYQAVFEQATAISDLFPWMQPRGPIQDVAKRTAGARILNEARKAEAKGLEALASLLEALA